MTEKREEETPVTPAPWEESPSSTGVVAGDGTEPEEAPPSNFETQ